MNELNLFKRENWDLVREKEQQVWRDALTRHLGATPASYEVEDLEARGIDGVDDKYYLFYRGEFLGLVEEVLVNGQYHLNFYPQDDINTIANIFKKEN